jgi:hypothetical protein
MTGETAKHASPKESFFNRHEAGIASVLGAAAVLTGAMTMRTVVESKPGDIVHNIVTNIPGVEEQITIPGPADINTLSMESFSVIMPEAA